MSILKSFIIAFSMYSKIPVPQFEWKEGDLKYVLVFFPVVGFVIGAVFLFWAWVCRKLQIGDTAYLLIGTAVPIIITGGFHVDGFMDTGDAICSYKGREEKLKILKDSHTGAFSVIMLLLYYLIYIAALSELKGEKMLAVTGIGFMLSRVLSGIGVIKLRAAKKDGMLRNMSDAAAKRTVFIVLLIELLLCAVGILALAGWKGILVLAGAGGSFIYYRYKSYKEFGGITGDTAGYFVLICEETVLIIAAVLSRV